MKYQEKLVRDNIPEIIRSSGKECNIETINNENILEYLYVKLYEETSELIEKQNLDELVDILELVFSIGKRYGYSEEEILNSRVEKKSIKGGFDSNILLKKLTQI